MASNPARPKAPAWIRAGDLNSVVATGTAGIPKFSKRIVSCKLHVVHDPQSAKPSMTASMERSCSITSGGAFLAKVGLRVRSTSATP